MLKTRRPVGSTDQAFWEIQNNSIAMLINSICFISNSPTSLLYYVLLIKQNESTFLSCLKKSFLILKKLMGCCFLWLKNLMGRVVSYKSVFYKDCVYSVRVYHWINSPTWNGLFPWKLQKLGSYFHLTHSFLIYYYIFAELQRCTGQPKSTSHKYTCFN